MKTCNCNIVDPDRRTFLAMALPACTMACLGIQTAFASAQSTSGPSPQPAKHKFDEEFKEVRTHRQFADVRFSDLIEIGVGLKKELGDEKAISLIKKITTDGWLAFAASQAAESPDGSFSNYIDIFRDKDRFKNILTMEIVEDTERAFELKVSECILAETFLKKKASDIGYAWICFGDYAWAEGFNPKIKLVRDKTLMQGHDYCNHRYLWTG